ncbi:uncharacterized protein LOC143225914 isoform X4 [Tachypleus tridentatus]|uniref:uncharacterized protein LOC143225914 isoform X4 n=1 Tax=Tachypleus tridentatus TaxID=6853 RepID=UPI003FD19A75
MESGSTTYTYMSGHLPPGVPLTKTDEDILRDAYQPDQNLPNVPGGSPPPGQTLTNSSASGSLSLASEASPSGPPALAEIVFSQYSSPGRTVSARDQLSPAFQLAPSSGSRTFNYGLEANLSPPSAVVDGVQECRLIDFHGAKLAAFRVNSEDLLCLPQAFDLFLKHLVGGLHTVYTKLKRLGITPIVCNVEQVRLLRGLGAIQPGVNRCKLLSCKDFEVLYRDCTTARLREDRPPELLTGRFKTYNHHNRRGKDATYLNGTTGNAHLSGLNLSQTSGLEEQISGRKNDLKYDSDYKDDDDIYSDDDYEFQKNEVTSGFPSGPGESSIETLLRNIQGLLKVAADNARHQDRQVNLEKAELKMEIVREKELRDSLEKQLLEEQKIRIIYQKRLKKERRTRRRLHEQFQVEIQKRTHCEEAFRNSSVDSLRLLNESLTDNVEKERNTRNETERKTQGSK